ncbi:hypothetical protein SUGI_0004370 [Cryptomeria japonica]|nr:hypothetical protein SUGI_0004370 [Cryptomeria japonica]
MLQRFQLIPELLHTGFSLIPSTVRLQDCLVTELECPIEILPVGKLPTAAKKQNFFPGTQTLSFGNLLVLELQGFFQIGFSNSN